MSTWLLIVVTLRYVGSAIDLALKKHFAQSLIFAGYALANVGLIISLQS